MRSILRRLPFLLVTAVAASTAVTAGIRATADVTPASSSHANSPSDISPSTHFPLDDYGFSDLEMSTMMQARQVLETRCMRTLGFTGDRFPLTATVQAVGVKSQMIRPLETADARRFGYHTPGDRATAKPAPPHITASLMKLESAAMVGRTASVNGRRVPEGGCTQEGMRQLMKGTSGPGAIPVRSDSRYLSAVAQKRALGDPHLRGILASWRSCMKSAGYPFAAPWNAEVANAPRQHDGLFHTNPTSAEIRQATADASCRAQTTLFQHWVATESVNQRQLISQNLTELTKAKAILAVWMANAKAAIAQGAGA